MKKDYAKIKSKIDKIKCIFQILLFVIAYCENNDEKNDIETIKIITGMLKEELSGFDALLNI